MTSAAGGRFDGTRIYSPRMAMQDDLYSTRVTMGRDYEKESKSFLGRDSFNVNCSRQINGTFRHYFRLGEQELGNTFRAER